MTRIFYADVSALENEELFFAYFKTASKDRQRKITSFKFDRDKRLSLGAYICYVEAMRAFDADSSAKWAYSSKGKPYFVEENGLYFSLSHSDNIAVAVVSHNMVGIDAEMVCSFREGVCRRYFTPSEARYVLKETAGRDERFFRIWTLKEAYSKMSGEGIGSFLNFEIIPENPPEVRSKGRYIEAWFHEFDIQDCRVALCIDGEDSFVSCDEINLCKLLIK